MQHSVSLSLKGWLLSASVLGILAAPLTTSVAAPPSPNEEPVSVFVIGERRVSLPTTKVGEVLLSPMAEALKGLKTVNTVEIAGPKCIIRLRSGRSVHLRAGKDAAWVDKGPRKLAASPLVRSRRLFLPVADIVELVDAAMIEADGVIHINAALREVALDKTGDSAIIHVTCTVPVERTLGRLSSPERVYVDLPGVVLVKGAIDLAPPSTEPAKGEAAGEEANSLPTVLRVRARQLSYEPDICRVVVDLSRPADYQVKERKSAAEFDLAFPEAKPAPKETAANAEKEVPAGPIPHGALLGWVIVVDPGHGGKDPGAYGTTGVHEKEIVLDLAQRLRCLLETAGAQALITRSDDTYVGLPDRVKFAVDAAADLFISIHVNAWPTANGKKGTEIFYYTNQSLPLARAIHDSMITSLGLPDGGIRKRRLFVCRNAPMPAVLTETAYLNHVDEEALLKDPAFRQKAARAIFDGIVAYADKHKKEQPE